MAQGDESVMMVLRRVQGNLAALEKAFERKLDEKDQERMKLERKLGRAEPWLNEIKGWLVYLAEESALSEMDRGRARGYAQYIDEFLRKTESTEVPAARTPSESRGEYVDFKDVPDSGGGQ